MKMLDRWIEGSARDLAKRTARRSVLARLGTLLIGGAAGIPLLPVARGAEPSRLPAPTEPSPDTSQGNPSACEYWRHCGIDGFPCASCGGSQTHCPPGTELSAATWIGICRNPTDSRLHHFLQRLLREEFLRSGSLQPERGRLADIHARQEQ